jgi:hypothetical protein
MMPVRSFPKAMVWLMMAAPQRSLKAMEEITNLLE